MKEIKVFIDQNLRNDGAEAISEIQALRTVVEQNPWHKNQSVFEHTKRVVESLKQHTDNELLLMAALFHDVAKPFTWRLDEQTGMTACPNHEVKGSELMDSIGPRIGLTGEDLKYVKEIIRMHDWPHVLVSHLVEEKEYEPYKEQFFTQTGLFAKDVLVHALADMEGSDLPVIDPVLFQDRACIIENLMHEC